jgi:predicted transcriptional regulator
MKLNIYIKKKQQLNKGSYISHLYNANQWQTLWTQMEQNINEKLNSDIKIELRN